MNSITYMLTDTAFIPTAKNTCGGSQTFKTFDALKCAIGDRNVLDARACTIENNTVMVVFI